MIMFLFFFSNTNSYIANGSIGKHRRTSAITKNEGSNTMENETKERNIDENPNPPVREGIQKFGLYIFFP